MTPIYYYSLLIRDNEHDSWKIHFGDYQKTVVEQERLDICEHDHLKKNTKIICTADDQKSINKTVHALNAAPFDPPFKILSLDNPADVHNTIADAIGEPNNKLKRR